MLRHVISHLHADGGAFQIAQVHALRRQDKMFEWLDHGLATRDPGVTTVLYAPFLGHTWSPRFAAFCKKMGLAGHRWCEGDAVGEMRVTTAEAPAALHLDVAESGVPHPWPLARFRTRFLWVLTVSGIGCCCS